MTATAAGDTGARRAVVALMLCGIALDAVTAPAAGVAAGPARAALHAGEAPAAAAAIAYQSLYLFAIAVSLWAAQVLGKRRYVAISFFGFAAASFACAAAPDGWTFAAGRALQGLALGGLFATCLLTFAATAPKRDLTTVFAVFAFLALAAPTAAPLLAGFVLEAGSWRAVFAVLALVSLAIGLPALRLMRDPQPPRPVPLDVPGALALLAAFVAFTLFTQTGGGAGALLLTVAATTIFALRQSTQPASPLPDVRILNAALVARGLPVCFLLGIVIASGEVQLQYARAALHLAPDHASAILALRIIGILAGGIAAAAAAARNVAGNDLVTCGFAALAAAFVVQGAVTAASLGEVPLSAVMLLQGAGFALVMGPLGSLLFAAVPQSQMPSLVVFFKLTVGIGNAFAAPLVAAFLALESSAGRIPAWAYADVWAGAAAIALVSSFGARALRTTAA